MTYQNQYVFFPRTSSGPNAEQRMAWLNPTKEHSPYYGYIGNSKAINKLMRIDFEALGNYNHVCPKLNIAFIGEAGSGKTELARRHAKANGLPFIEISPKAVKKADDIFNLVRSELESADPAIDLVEIGEEDHYKFPPINVFIDEIHALSSYLIQALLKATEPKDSILVTESGIVVDCANVHWMIATTDRGKLFDAFDTRFSKVHVNLYNKNEIAQIVKINYPSWPFRACMLAAHYCSRVPRETLSFAKEMQLEYNMSPRSWDEIARSVAIDNEIDEYGMTLKRLTILKALGQGPIAEKRLPMIAGVKVEELNKFIMPWLLVTTEDQPPLVTVTSKGFAITEAGLAELDKRGIAHKGEAA